MKKEVTKEDFMKLYRSGYNDTEISEILKISQSSVNDYRKSLNLKTQNKRRKKEPAATGKRKII